MISGEPSGGGAVALGVIVGLLSTGVQSLGLTLQRKSHLLEDEKEEHLRKKPYRRRRWQLGMAMFLIANIVGSSIQITTLPLPVLSTLQASGLVFNTACATLLLAEPFTKLSAIGTVLVTIGAVLIGTFGAINEPSHNLQQLLVLLVRRDFLLWLGGTLFIVFLVIVGTWVMRRVYPWPNTPRMRLLRGMSFGFISGVLSAHSLLVAKSAVELIVRTIVDRHNQFDRWQSWLILVALLFFALTQLYYLHCGLKLCSTSVLYPFVFCVYNIIAILDGLIYFHQSSRLTKLDAGLVALGTAVLLSGVLSLSWRLSEADKEVDEEPERAARIRKRAMSRVATPSTALVPGMGLVPASEALNPEHEDYIGAADDPEAHGAGIHTDNVNENTPLLRTSTAPVSTLPKSKKRRGLSRPEVGKKRRMTVSEEGREIWDELLDRRRPSTGSPHKRRGSEGNLLSPASRKTKRRSWAHEGESSRQEGTSAYDMGGQEEDGREQQLADEEETDASTILPERDLEGRSRSEQSGQGWFKLRWWRKRWRDGTNEEG